MSRVTIDISILQSAISQMTTKKNNLCCDVLPIVDAIKKDIKIVEEVPAQQSIQTEPII